MEALYLCMRGSIAPAHREVSILHLKLIPETFEPVNLPPQSMPAAGGAFAFFSAMLGICVTGVRLRSLRSFAKGRYNQWDEWDQWSI